MLRVLIVLLPGVASLLAVFGVARAMPAPSGQAAWLAVLRLALLVAVACGVAYAVERAVRRLTPLVMLLRMSMLFPGRAPSRFRLARKACSTDVSAALRPRAGDDAAAVAERAVTLLAALSSHDRHTRGHSQRVQVLAEMLARELGLDSADRQRLRWAALLHDIGKLSVSATVLTKPSALADEEWTQMRRHPEEGARLCGPLLDWLGEWGDAIPQHHERFDGTGYPRGLRGAAISRAGRVVCLVDAYETMTAARPYKRPMATRDARAELARCAGAHFDPVMVRAFLAVSLPRLLWASGPVSFLLQLPFLPLIQAGTRTANAAFAAAGTGVVAGGVAVVIATVPAPVAPSTSVSAAGTSSASSVAGAPTSGPAASTPGAGAQGTSTAAAAGVGPAVAPTASAQPSTSAPGPGAGATGGSGSGTGGTPAPSASGLLPPLVPPRLPDAVASAVASTVVSTVPSAVTSVIAGVVPSVSASPGGVTVTVPGLPGVIPPVTVTVKPGKLLG